MKSSSFANAQNYTFVVNDVELAQSLLPTDKPKQLVESVLKYPLEACSNYSRNLLSGISTNPLVTAAKLAFDQHRPLVLYPDAIWLTLVQGISEHIVAQGESISRKILRFGESRIEIPVSTDSFPIGSPENPWDEIVSSACNQLLSFVHHDFHWLFETSYSTTQPTDRTAVEISLLAGLDRHVGMFDTWQICGFPSITLEGTLDDWCLLQSKLANFGKLGLGWWAKKLKPLMQEFVSAIRGNPDLGFWEKMVYKDPPFQCNASEVVNGWISILFPYGARYGDCPQRQKLDGSDNLDIIDYPLGLGSVSMASKNASKVHLYAGFLGIEQLEDFSLRPMTGWAVRRQSSFECILDDVERHERCKWTPAKRGPKANILSRRQLSIRDSLGSTVEEMIKNILIESKQLQAFYSRFEDLEVCSKSGDILFRVRKSGEALRVRDPSNTEKISQLHRIVDMADGRIIGLKDCSEFIEGTRQQYSAFFLTDMNNAIEALACPLIATSFEHVLRLLLDAENTTIELSQFYQPIGCVSPNDHEAVLRLIVT